MDCGMAKSNSAISMSNKTVNVKCMAEKKFTPVNSGRTFDNPK